MNRYEGQTLIKKVLVVEECWLINCVLRECVLFYSGGAYQMENVQWENCQWKFLGPAQMTVSVLSMIGLLPQMRTIPQMSPPTGPVN